jgi:CRISPR/Cas system-associated protein Cas10 (large subunit of type III CRISPR-Cas system)
VGSARHREKKKRKGAVAVGLLGRAAGSARKVLVGWLTDLGRKLAWVRC